MAYDVKVMSFQPQGKIETHTGRSLWYIDSLKQKLNKDLVNNKSPDIKLYLQIFIDQLERNGY